MPVGQRPHRGRGVAFELDPLGGQPVAAQRLQVSGGLGGDQLPERVALARDLDVALRLVDELQEASRRRPALVQLSGRVQEPRAVAEGHGRARGSRIAARSSADGCVELIGRRPGSP